MGWQKFFMVQRGGEGRPVGSCCNCDNQSLKYQNSGVRLLSDKKLHKQLQHGTFFIPSWRNWQYSTYLAFFLPFYTFGSRETANYKHERKFVKKSKFSWFQLFLHEIKAMDLHVTRGDFCLCASFLRKYRWPRVKLKKKIDILNISSCFFSRIENLPLVLTYFRSKGSRDLKFEIQGIPPVNLFDVKPSQNYGDFKLLSLECSFKW